MTGAAADSALPTCTDRPVRRGIEGHGHGVSQRNERRLFRAGAGQVSYASCELSVGGRRCLMSRVLLFSVEDGHELGQGMVAADVAGEDDAGHADGLGAASMGPNTGSRREQLAGDLRGGCPGGAWATSWEVIAPLAVTQAARRQRLPGGAGQGGAGVRVMARLPVAPRPRARLVRCRTSDRLSAADSCRAVSAATWSGLLMTEATSGSIPVAARGARRADLAGMRSRDDQAVPGASWVGPDFPSAKRWHGCQASQGSHERGTGTEQERLAGPLGQQHPACHRLQVGVLRGVDGDPRPVTCVGQQVTDPGRPAGPDVGQAGSARSPRPVVPPPSNPLPNSCRRTACSAAASTIT